MENHECDECGWEFVINYYSDAMGHYIEVRCPNCDCLVYEV